MQHVSIFKNSLSGQSTFYKTKQEYIIVFISYNKYFSLIMTLMQDIPMCY